VSRLAPVLAAAGLLGAGAGSPGGATPPAFALRSAAFAEGAAIPTRFTCEGADVSPPLAWDEPPPGTRSLALVVSDPDAPDPKAPQRTWVHWVLYDLPATARSLPESAPASALPGGTRQGRNDWGSPGYRGPCPPIGRHRYFFVLYALDAPLGDRGALGAGEVEAALQGHLLGRAELVGTYEKSGDR
jgi:Raf kinase inhibitor-like YbhB/YbcL family protein